MKPARSDRGGLVRRLLALFLWFVARLLVLCALLSRWVRGWLAGRSPRERGLVLGVAAVLLAVALLFAFGGPRRLAYAVRDRVGVSLVEGQADSIRKAAEATGVDPYLIAAVMFQESRGRVGARSDADALGLMQLQLPTARDAARRAGLPEPLEEQLLEDPELNVLLGAGHLAWLLEAGEGEWNLEQNLVAYHCGRTGLRRRIEEAGSYRAWVEDELERKERTGEMSASLSYAWRVLDTQDFFRGRGSF